MAAARGQMRLGLAGVASFEGHQEGRRAVGGLRVQGDGVAQILQPCQHPCAQRQFVRVQGVQGTGEALPA